MYIENIENDILLSTVVFSITSNFGSIELGVTWIEVMFGP